MEAGRTLDALVAEKVMGWHRTVFTVGGRAAGVELDVPYWTDTTSNAVCREWDWHPSKDIAAAWQVVEKMYERDLFLDLENRVTIDEKPWWAEFANDDYTKGACVHADTAPMAICLAALQAVGVDVDVENPSKSV